MQIRGRESGCGRLRAPIMPLDANVRQIQANRRTACTETIVTELLYRQARARLISLAIAAGMLLERPLKSGGEQPSRAVERPSNTLADDGAEYLDPQLSGARRCSLVPRLSSAPALSRSLRGSGRRDYLKWQMGESSLLDLDVGSSFPIYIKS